MRWLGTRLTVRTTVLGILVKKHCPHLLSQIDGRVGLCAARYCRLPRENKIAACRPLPRHQVGNPAQMCAAEYPEARHGAEPLVL
jgi:hypothetical protein